MAGCFHSLELCVLNKFCSPPQLTADTCLRGKWRRSLRRAFLTRRLLQLQPISRRAPWRHGPSSVPFLSLSQQPPGVHAEPPCSTLTSQTPPFPSPPPPPETQAPLCWAWTGAVPLPPADGNRIRSLSPPSTGGCPGDKPPAPAASCHRLPCVIPQPHSELFPVFDYMHVLCLLPTTPYPGQYFPSPSRRPLP